MPVHAVNNNLSAFSSFVLLPAWLFLLLVPLASARNPDTSAADTEASDVDTGIVGNAKDYQKEQGLRNYELKHLGDSLVTPELSKKFEEIERHYRQKILPGGATSNADREVLRTGIQYEVYILSDRNVQNDPRRLGIEYDAVSGHLKRAGSNYSTADTKKRFRRLLCDEAVSCIKELMKNNFLSRSLGLELLLDLEVVQPKGGARIQMHDQVASIYVQVLTNPDETDVVKARAANCVRKFLQKADAIPDPNVQVPLAKALASELRRDFTAVAYQDLLLSALEHIRSPRDIAGDKRPLHMQVAAEVMRDRTRNVIVRSRCARVLGRAGYDKQLDLEALSWMVTDLTLEVGLQYNLQNDRNHPKWLLSGRYLASAFRHDSKNEAIGRPPAGPKGFLNRNSRSEFIREASAQSLVIIAHLISAGGGIDQGHFSGMDKWLNANKPEELRVDPSCPLLEESRPSN